MGIALKDQGKLDEAIEAYKKAISIKPDYAEAYNNMGNALQDKGTRDEAIEAYKKAISITPDYAEAYYNMGVSLQDKGKLDEAIDTYKKQSPLSLHMLRPITTWEMLSKIRASRKAIELTKAISIKPDYAEAYNNTGNIFKSQNKPGKAIEAYKKRSPTSLIMLKHIAI